MKSELGEREQELEQLHEKVRALEQLREYDVPEGREGDSPVYRIEMPVQERAQVEQQVGPDNCCANCAVVMETITYPPPSSPRARRWW